MDPRSSVTAPPLRPPLAPLLWRLFVAVCAITAAALLPRLATAALTPAFGAVLSAAAVQRLATAAAAGGVPLVLGTRRHWPAREQRTRNVAGVTTAFPPAVVAAASAAAATATAAVWPLLAPVLPHALGAYSVGVGAVANAAFAAATASAPPPSKSGWLACMVSRWVAAAGVGPAAAVGAVTTTAATTVGAMVVGPPVALAAALVAAALPSRPGSVPPWWWAALSTTTAAAVVAVRWGVLPAVEQLVGRPAAATGGLVATCLVAAVASAMVGGLGGAPPQPGVPAGQDGRGGGVRGRRPRGASAGRGAAANAAGVAPLLAAAAVPVVAVAAALWTGAGAPPLPPDGWLLHRPPGGSSVRWRPPAAATVAGSLAAGVPWPTRVSVLTHVSRELRPTVLAVDHSLLGGDWETGDSIFGVFNIHEAVVLSRGRAGRPAAEAVAAAEVARLQVVSTGSGVPPPLPPPPPRARTALVLGLGAGCSAKGLTAAGYTVTGVEVDAAVAAAAADAFGCAPSSCGRLVIDDAAAYVYRAVAAGTTYDAVLLDVFSGGGVALHMFSPSTLADVAAVVAPGGLLVVNTVGLVPPMMELESVADGRRAPGTVESGDPKGRAGPLPTVDWAAGVAYDGIPAAAGALAPHFPHLRAFVDAPPSRTLHNVVLFAGGTAEAVSFRDAVPSDGVLGSTLREEQLREFVDREVTLAVAGRMAAMAASEGYGAGGWRRAVRGTRWVDAIRRAQGVSAAEHWRVMRLVVDAPVWAALAVG